LPVVTSRSTHRHGGRLVDTACALFARHGSARVSMERVAAEAGVPTASLRDEFPTKTALVHAARQRGHDDWFADLAACTAAELPPLDRILALFSFLEQQDAEPEHPPCVCTASGGRSAADHVDELHEVVGGLVHGADLPAFLTGALCLLVEGTATSFAVPARAGRTAAAVLLAVYETDDAHQPAVFGQPS
jgi:AcrR family transcriptional regulator